MWYKDAMPYAGPKMSAAWYAANGYTTTAPTPTPTTVVKRFSKYKIIRRWGVIAGE